MAALTIESVKDTEVVLGRLGKNEIGLTNFDNSSLPDVAQGSVISIGSSIAYAPSDLSVGDLAGAADGIVYLYVEADGTLSVSSTAPTWSDVYQGWYNGTSRCYGQLLKSGASYTIKTIYKSRDYGVTAGGIAVCIGANADRVIQFGTEAAMTYDHSESAIDIGTLKYRGDFDYISTGSLQLATTTTGSVDITIKKPVAAYILRTGTESGYGLQISQNGGWRMIASGTTTDTYGLFLMPGNYRLYVTSGGTAWLYASGVFSKASLTLAEIVA